MLRADICLSAQKLLLVGLKEPFEMLRIEARLAACKISAQPTVLSLQALFKAFKATGRIFSISSGQGRL